MALPVKPQVITLHDDDISDDDKDFKPVTKKPKVGMDRTNSQENLSQKTLKDWCKPEFNFGTPRSQSTEELRPSQSAKPGKGLSQNASGKPLSGVNHNHESDDEVPLRTSKERGSFFRSPQFATKGTPLAAPEKGLTADNLAVHPKKVDEVRKWLSKCDFASPSILLLVGPAGCGKTTTLNVVARELRVETVEWINPVDQIFSQKISRDELVLQKDFEDYVPKMQKFISFVSKAARYPSLPGAGDGDYQDAGSSRNLKKVIVIEDFPNLEHHETKVKFHACVREYLGSHSSSVPLVFIVSDVFTSHSDLRVICPEEFTQTGRVTQIDFNPVAVTLLTKALKRAAFQVSQNWESQVTNQQIETIAKNSSGDVRCAVNCLRFFMLKKPPPKSRATSQTPQVGVPYEETLGRDCSVALFHAVGKMCYSKRLPPTEEYFLTNSLPPHMSRLERHPMKSEPEEVVSSLHMDAPTFNMFVHQNYLNFFKDCGEVEIAAGYAADADLLTAGPHQENEKMWEYSTSVFCRGMLFAREDQSTPSFSAFYKPELFHVQKAARENQQQLDDLYSSYLENFAVSPHCGGGPASRRTFAHDFLPTTKAIWKSKELKIPDFIRKHKNTILSLSQYTARTMKSMYSGGRQPLVDGEQQGVEETFDDDEARRAEVDDAVELSRKPADENAAAGTNNTEREAKILAATIERKLYLEDDDIED